MEHKWTPKESEKWEMSMSVVVIDWQIMEEENQVGDTRGCWKEEHACNQDPRRVERGNWNEATLHWLGTFQS